MKRQKWAIEPKYRIVTEIQFNDNHTLPPRSSPTSYRKIIDVNGNYKISPIHASIYRNMIFNLFSHLMLGSFDVSTRFNSKFYAVHCIRLNRKHRKYGKHHSIEAIFKISDSINTDLSMYPGRIPLIHNISINSKHTDNFMESIDIMHEFYDEILHGNYSSLIKL